MNAEWCLYHLSLKNIRESARPELSATYDLCHFYLLDDQKIGDYLNFYYIKFFPCPAKTAKFSLCVVKNKFGSRYSRRFDSRFSVSLCLIHLHPPSITISTPFIHETLTPNQTNKTFPQDGPRHQLQVGWNNSIYRGEKKHIRLFIRIIPPFTHL